ncbi:phytanoyl-CoA dioxygenase family protein [Dyadobacter fanqingshengii]|uniref:Phytanoyl-CoA dioxygenase family protein n=1 Tax=Dyadobacter fanqingshengii TaxID=2906443 RepID=A0A9X1PDE0_9BACT|nr:phytanoyl-CoA dioxygenase family protein [Dyadobacter fanqingshengii]MCF0042497.1 phytanoyl-CoA dioxygenase family protein [Dyadobacter fanqingshengii]USJ34980.1 phytanoyl-CoA dioxygenase family protein [Dyadobacter fanqingshengii]
MSIVQRVLRKAESIKDHYFPIKEFDQATLPWIDKPNADIAGFLKKNPPRYDVPYDMADKLRNWEQNGYVVLEKIIPEAMIDNFWGDFQKLVQNPDKYDLSVRIDLDEFKPNQERNIKEFPKEALLGKYVKINDFHNSSVAGKKLMTHPYIVSFLEAIFNQKIVVMQSLVFMYGSQQPTHQDFPWVTAKIPSHLAAAWIALEDIKIDSGPLYYYIGSHKMPKFNFGSGILFKKDSTKSPLEFAQYLDQTCAEHQYPRETLLIKKGDVLIWHAALAHGGSMITNPEQTRKSFVCHYSTEQALPYHRNFVTQVPVKQDYNGVNIYNNPIFPQSEDVLK